MHIAARGYSFDVFAVGVCCVPPRAIHLNYPGAAISIMDNGVWQRIDVFRVESDSHRVLR